MRRLPRNLEDALQLAGTKATVTRDFVRLYLESDDPAAFEAARRVFGIQSISPCVDVPAPSVEAVLAAGEELFAERVRGQRFAVRSKVRGLGPNSLEINAALGAALAAYGKVDLTDPEITVQLDVREGTARFFTEKLMAADGLPAGVEGRGVMLLSGGFDSAVAAWMALRRGVALDYVFCRLGGPEHERAVLTVANHLATQWSGGTRPRLFVVPFEPIAERIGTHVAEPMRQLVLKHLMYLVGDAIGTLVKADAVFTGEALGQVSSQTLRNLRALRDPGTLPILRPLLGFTKLEIIARAKQIGTHDLCAGTPEYCALVPRRPATSSTQREIESAALPLEFERWEAAHFAQRVDLPAAPPEEEEQEELDTAPSGWTVLDIRSESAHRTFHEPGWELFSPARASEELEELDDGRNYLVVCEFGLRSSWFARHMRRLGFTAASLRGGAARLMVQAGKGSTASEGAPRVDTRPGGG